MKNSAIEKWIVHQNFTREEERENEIGYGAPSGAFLLLNSGDNESPFWKLFYPPGDGEQADETGSWDEIPNWDESDVGGYYVTGGKCWQNGPFCSVACAQEMNPNATRFERQSIDDDPTGTTHCLECGCPINTGHVD
jgi:hypothetical protein